MAITVAAASLAAVSVVSYEVYRLLFDRRHVPDAGPLALPVFRDVLSGIYPADLVGAAPVFPAEMEARITAALQPPLPLLPATSVPAGYPVPGAQGILPVSAVARDSD